MKSVTFELKTLARLIGTISKDISKDNFLSLFFASVYPMLIYVSCKHQQNQHATGVQKRQMNMHLPNEKPNLLRGQSNIRNTDRARCVGVCYFMCLLT